LKTWGVSEGKDICLGPIHKRRSQSGGFVQYGQRGGGVLQMRTSALFGAKNIGFFEIYGVSARNFAGVKPVRTFCGCPLWTAPYVLNDGICTIAQKMT